MGIALLLVLGGSAFAYRITHPQPQQKLQEEAGKTDTMPVSTANPGNLTMGIVGNSNSEATDSATSQPVQSSQQASTFSRQSTPQTKTSCTTVTIPHGIKYQETSTLTQGETRQWLPGSDGLKQVCISNTGISSEIVISSPSDAVVQVGTTPATPVYTYDQAWSAAQSACAGIYYDSSYHGNCVAAEMNKRGWYYRNGQWVNY